MRHTYEQHTSSMLRPSGNIIKRRKDYVFTIAITALSQPLYYRTSGVIDSIEKDALSPLQALFMLNASLSSECQDP